MDREEEMQRVLSGVIDKKRIVSAFYFKHIADKYVDNIVEKPIDTQIMSDGICDAHSAIVLLN